MIKYLETIRSYGDKDMCKVINGAEASCKSYADFCNDMERYAYKIDMEMGGIKGKHVGIIASASYEYFVLLGAIIFGRAVAIPLNNLESIDNISHAIDNAEINLLIVDCNAEKYVRENLPVMHMETFFEEEEGRLLLEDFRDIEKDELALILFTSGTTSVSKGVMQSVDNLFHARKDILPKSYLEKKENPVGALAYTNFPFYHVGGILLFLSWPLNGVTMCLSKDPRNILSDLENNSIDIGAIIPSTFKLWSTCIRKDRMDRLGHVRHVMSGGAALDAELVKLFINKGISVGQFYGQTEVGGSVTVNYDMVNHADSVGQPSDGAEVFIEDGEICVRYWGNMTGYYNNAEETKKSLRNGVIYTGDLGYIDKDGYVYITGRKNNLIILSGGQNVSPEEIEAKIYENEAIRECRVYAKGDRIAAQVYAPDIKEEEIRNYIDELNAKLSIYKRIYSLEIMDTEIEKTASGKIKR